MGTAFFASAECHRTEQETDQRNERARVAREPRDAARRQAAAQRSTERTMKQAGYPK